MQKDPNTDLIKLANQLKLHGLLFYSAHANLSLRIGDRILFTRGGNVGNLTEMDLVWMDMTPSLDELSQLEPVFAEVVNMHLRLYSVRADIGSIVHCHAPYATSFSVAHEAIPLVYEPLLRLGFTRPVPLVRWSPRGSDASVDGIVSALCNPGVHAALMANHGIIVVGNDAGNVLSRLIAVEETARLAIAAASLGGAKALPDGAFKEVQDRMKRFL